MYIICIVLPVVNSLNPIQPDVICKKGLSHSIGSILFLGAAGNSFLFSCSLDNCSGCCCCCCRRVNRVRYSFQYKILLSPGALKYVKYKYNIRNYIS